MKTIEITDTLRNLGRISYGHYRIECIINDATYTATTTNTMAIDAAFDNEYDNNDNTGRFFKSQKEAREQLIDEIVKANL